MKLLLSVAAGGVVANGRIFFGMTCALGRGLYLKWLIHACKPRAAVIIVRYRQENSQA